MQFGPSGPLLEKKSHFVLEGLPEEAVDERVEAAVRERCQSDSVTCQGVVLPQRAAVCVTSQEVDAYEGILREPAEEEDKHRC